MKLKKSHFCVVCCREKKHHLHYFDFPIYGDDYRVLFFQRCLVCRSCLANDFDDWPIDTSYHISMVRL